MKGAALFIAIFAFALLMIPMIAMSFDTAANTEIAAQIHTPKVPTAPAASSSQADRQGELAAMQPDLVLPDVDSQPATQDAEPQEATGISRYGVASFRILNESTGVVETVSLRDYVRGAVAAEMPVSFHPEALKTQAVAAHTFALHNHIIQLQNPDPALKGADFAADPDHMLVYITEETAKEFYGNNADQYWQKICDAADSVVMYVMEYENEPIVAAYHAISAGQTEDAVNVWTGTAPYLRAADSQGDYLAPDYETTVMFTPEELQKRILAKFPEADFSGDPDDWFDGFARSSSGYVTEVMVGGQVLHGKDVRELLDLRSHNFDVEYADDGKFHFTVYGYGHGVGLSQYGADFMARQGNTFEEILRNYYTGAVLKQIVLAEEQV